MSPPGSSSAPYLGPLRTGSVRTHRRAVRCVREAVDRRHRHRARTHRLLRRRLGVPARCGWWLTSSDAGERHAGQSGVASTGAPLGRIGGRNVHRDHTPRRSRGVRARLHPHARGADDSDFVVAYHAAMNLLPAWEICVWIFRAHSVQSLPFIALLVGRMLDGYWDREPHSRLELPVLLVALVGGGLVWRGSGAIARTTTFRSRGSHRRPVVCAVRSCGSRGGGCVAFAAPFAVMRGTQMLRTNSRPTSTRLRRGCATTPKR